MEIKNKIGLGTSLFGNNPAMLEVHQGILEFAIDTGYRLFDTAESYGSHYCEKILGQAIKNSGLPRSEFQICSKVRPMLAQSPAALISQCEQSAERLGTDYIDFYLLHWLLPEQRDSNQRLLELVSTFAELKQRGLIRTVGLSNFSIVELDRWQWAEDHLKLPAQDRVGLVQFRYSIVCRQADVFLNQRLLENNIISMPHSPFGGGRFSGSSRPPQPGFHGDFWVNPKTQALKPIAESIGATLPQFILAFTHRFSNSIAIPKSFKKQNLIDNLRADQFVQRINKTIFDQVTELFPIQHPFPESTTAEFDVEAATFYLRELLPD